MGENLFDRLDLFLSREEHEYISVERLRNVYLQDRDDARVDVVRLWRFGIEDIDRVHPPRYHKDTRVVKILGKLLRVQGGAADHQLEILPKPNYILHQPK